MKTTKKALLRVFELGYAAPECGESLLTWWDKIGAWIYPLESEKKEPERPSEYKMRITVEVCKRLGDIRKLPGDLNRFDTRFTIVSQQVAKVMQDWYPSQSCATCGFCMEPLGIEGAIEEWVCVNKHPIPRHVYPGADPKLKGSRCTFHRRKEESKDHE